MSSVRMCDKCGQIFRESAEGSQMLNGSRVVKVEGRTTTVSEAMDICPECSTCQIDYAKKSITS